MNVWPIRPQPKPGVTTLENESTEKDASNFLSFRLLNKRARVRLSPGGHDLKPLPGKAQLLVVANSKGWFGAVTRTSSGEHQIIFSPLSDLRAAFASSEHNEDNEISLSPKRTLSLSSAHPDFMVLAANDSRLALSLLGGPVLVFDTAQLFTEGNDQVTPIHQFAPTVPTPVRQIVANPGDIAELVAVLRAPDDKSESQLVDILDVVKLQSAGGWKWLGTPETTPTALSWSPKGKQIAVGLENGDILTFSPTSTAQVKSKIPKAPASRQPSVFHAAWLTNPAFHVVYAPPGARLPTDTEQSHYIVSMDTKSNSLTTTKLATPCYPFPGNRPPSTFMLVLRNWEPTKFLMVMGDSGSSDVGVIACMSDPLSPAQERWYNLTMDENATATMPLDQDLNETVMVGLELDTTNTDAFHSTSPSGEAFEVPPPPIVYVYCNDGTMQAWFLVNAGAPAYSGMLSSGAISATPSSSSISAPALQTRDVSITMGSATQPNTPTVTGFGQAPPAQSAFGQSSTQPAFGQPSGFAGFANNKPSAFGQTSSFGQTGFGFGAGSAPTPSAPAIEATPSNDMSVTSEADDALGGLSLGGTSSTPKGTEEKKPSIFGTFGQPSTNNDQSSAFSSAGGAFSGLKSSTSGFGAFSQGTSSFLSTPSASSSDAIKPASGFGAFSNVGSQSSASAPSASTETAKPSSAFGSSGFATKPASAFGQSGFGQPSSFGNAPATTPSNNNAFGSGSTGAGFAAFAGRGTGSFSPALKQSDSPSTTTSVFGSAGSAGSTATSAFGSSSTGATSVFGNPLQNQSENTLQLPEKPATPPASSVLASPPSSPHMTEKDLASPSKPAPSGGAFGGLKATPSSFIKPGQGFGLAATSDSPFMQPKKPVEGFTALSQPGLATPSTPAKPSPAFGAPSPLGAGKSVFGQSTFGSAATPVSTPKPAAPTTPIVASTGAFSAFSGGSGGFGAFAGAAKPFSALLREGKEDSPAPKPVSVFGTPQKSTPTSPDEGPKTPPLTESADTSGNQEPLKLSDLTKEPSLGSLSLSSTSRDSSFVDVARAVEEETPRSPEPESDADDDAVSFLSEDFEEGEGEEVPSEGAADEEGEEEEGDEKGEEEEEEEEEEDGDPVPRTSTPVQPSTPTPAVRSPSATPKAAAPAIKSSPPPESPATPSKDQMPSLFKTPSHVGKDPPPHFAAPAPVTPATPSTPFSLGIGKPSTRPARSSPLARAAATPDEEVGNAPKIPAPIFGAKQSPAESPASEGVGSHPKASALSNIFGPPAPAPTVAAGFLTPKPALPPPTPGFLNLPPGPLFSTPSSSKPATPPPATAAGGLFGASKPTTPPVPSPTTPTTPAPKAPTFENEMQAEYARLFAMMAREIVELRKYSETVRQETAALKAPVSMKPGAIVFDDIGRLNEKFVAVESEVVELKARKKSYNQAIRELEGGLLKATTKREEIVRFSKASKDPEFAKAVRIRSLGPEYAETQSQLRRNIKAARDRVETLEDHIRTAKKRMKEYKTGKAAFRHPPLEAIHRTYDNIDDALDQEAADIADIADRIAQLRLEKKVRARRLPSDVSHQREVTPDVAVTTAAALNAERSAQRLKRALLAARKEPLLNKQALEVAAPTLQRLIGPVKKEQPAASTSFLTLPAPGTPVALAPTFAPATPVAPKAEPDFFDLGPLPPVKSEPIDLPEFKLPPLDNAEGWSSHGGRQKSTKWHMKSAQLKKSPSPAKVPSTSGPVSFDWGPLPGIKPKSSLSADVRPEKEKGKTPSMEGSWVLDDFQSK
ncbi:hypothetical protein OE88DRAFT_308545 [Heliocybe sulcata]|uniref:Nucleoporin Nup159/Nup146 N-terminal domain-containing protein n=1 Tax=Heliocybe sulcata TaxID=5364 RepID=A0A5C3MYT3_9AGAM|nr:hypothetical protein OE88DRAFT_308545 [Heliocybe sulcata]